MKITTEHHYILTDCTEKEAREYEQELSPKYEQTTRYSTPFDCRIICHAPITQRCEICDGEFFNLHTCI